MKHFLVGGAVRDRLLGRKIRERDWVVLGETPERMIRRGFKQVGKDFPVFLHPETQEEYALARTERKAGQGYHGFVCDFSKDVTLEMDLARRDLTINALAMTEEGTLIDPYGGRCDLEARILRHVSPAFVEDPLRILRLFRFQSQLASYGFSVAQETLILIRKMCRERMLQELGPERIGLELRKVFSSPQPSCFFKGLYAVGGLQHIAVEWARLFGLPTPNGDLALHTLQNIDRAAHQRSEAQIFALWALPFGLETLPVQDWPIRARLCARGPAIAQHYVEHFGFPKAYQELATLLHRSATTFLEHPTTEINAEAWLHWLESIDAWRRHERIQLLLPLMLDIGLWSEQQKKYFENFFEKSRALRPPQNVHGLEAKHFLRGERLRMIEAYKKDFGGFY